ncbi:17108_t:CDS:2, partial [Cetraspora pellucida]
MTTVIEIFLQELTETEPADVIVKPPSYDHKDKTRTKVHLTYQVLRNMTSLRNHKDSSQQIVLANRLTKHYEIASTR